MWKSLSIIAAILTAGGAFLTYKNLEQGKREAQLLNIARDNLAKAQQQLKLVTDAVAANKEGKEKTEAEVTSIEKQLEALKAQVDELTKQVADKKSELEVAVQRYEEVRGQVDGLGGVEKLRADLQEMVQKKAALDSQVAAVKVQAAAALQSVTSLNNQIVALKTKEQWQNKGIMPENFKARIIQVDPTWGYLIINAGDTSGVVSGATLDIRRGGAVVGQAKVTNVEPNRAVADVVTANGFSAADVQPGDTVTVAAVSSSRYFQPAAPPSTTSSSVTTPSVPAESAPLPPDPGAAFDPTADPFSADETPAPAPSEPAPVEPPADAPSEVPADPFAN